MSDLQQRFEAAVAQSKTLPERPDNATLLEIYALYKQGTSGDARGRARASATWSAAPNTTPGRR